MDISLGSLAGDFCIRFHDNPHDATPVLAAAHLVLSGRIDDRSARSTVDLLDGFAEDPRTPQLEVTVSEVEAISIENAELIMDAAVRATRVWHGDLLVSGPVRSQPLLRAAVDRGIGRWLISPCACEPALVTT